MDKKYKQTKKISLAGSYIITILSFLLFPILTSAQSIGPKKSPSNFREVICIFSKLVLDFIPYVFVIAIGAFLTGLIKYVGNGDNEEKRTEGTKMMVYGVLGFFFMVSVWGILKLFVSSFGFTDFGIPQFNSPEKFKDACNTFL